MLTILGTMRSRAYKTSDASLLVRRVSSVLSWKPSSLVSGRSKVTVMVFSS